MKVGVLDGGQFRVATMPVESLWATIAKFTRRAARLERPGSGDDGAVAGRAGVAGAAGGFAAVGGAGEAGDVVGLALASGKSVPEE